MRRLATLLKHAEVLSEITTPDGKTWLSDGHWCIDRAAYGVKDSDLFTKSLVKRTGIALDVITKAQEHIGDYLAVTEETRQHPFREHVAHVLVDSTGVRYHVPEEQRAVWERKGSKLAAQTTVHSPGTRWEARVSQVCVRDADTDALIAIVMTCRD